MPTLHTAERREATPAALANVLRPTVARLARRLRQQDHTGLGPTMTATLASIAKHGGPTQGELAAIEQVAPPTITAVVDKLEKLGLVTRETDLADRRVTRVRATPSGIEQLDEVRNRRTSWLASRLTALTEDERVRLADAADVLAKLVDVAMVLPMADLPVDTSPVRIGMFQSLRVRNFRLFFGGQLISQIGNWLTLIAQALLVLKLTDSGFALGLLAACQFGPVLVLGAWAGLVADRSDKRKLLLAVQAFAMVQSFALAFVAFMHHPPVAAIYIVAVFGGVATAFDNPARRAYVVEMVPEANVQNAVSLNSALMTGSRVVGPALAGLLITTVGYGWTFAADGVSYVAVIVGLFLMRTSDNRPHLAAGRGKGQVREGLRYVRTMPELFVPLVMMAIVGTFAFNFQTVMPLLVKRTLHGNDRTFTLIYSVIAVGSLFGALLSARRSSVSVRHIIVSCYAFGVAMLLLAVTPNVPFTYPIGVLVGISSITFMTTSTAIVQLRADPSMRGRVLALQAIVFLGSTPIGGPILGWVCQHYGARTGVVIGGVSAIVAGVYGMRAVRATPAVVGPSVATPDNRDDTLVPFRRALHSWNARQQGT